MQNIKQSSKCHRTQPTNDTKRKSKLTLKDSIMKSEANRPIGYQIIFMLNSAEHEIFSANKYENSYLLAEIFMLSYV